MVKKKTGDELANTFTGGNKADAYDGLAGIDTISGMGGNDKLWGGDDNDDIWGGQGADKIWGGKGHDRIFGDTGKDTLWGGADTDAFIFNQGGKYAPGSDVDIIKDIDTKGDDMDDIQIQSMDASIDSYADIRRHARQDGADVRIDFGHGDVLILAHTKLRELSPELFMYDH